MIVSIIVETIRLTRSSAWTDPMALVGPRNSAKALKPVHFHILVVLLSGPRHGYGIVKEIEERTGGRVRLEPGNLYRYLNQLRRGDLVEESPEPADAGASDERRRYYRITPAGRGALAADVARMKALVDQAEAELGLAALPSPGATP
jgi:DNA-binding PadR family transcriptional regulator